METMYPAIVNSPITQLANNIAAGDTSIQVTDASKLPDAPNIATIGRGENAETILYAGKSGNTLTGVTRGFQGIARDWAFSTQVARFFTAYDFESFKQNIEENHNRQVTHEAEMASFITNNPDAKNSIYRGKFLGNEVTAKQWADIANGTFEDMYIGDYWYRNGMDYLIGAFNYYLNTGDTNTTVNHITLIPRSNLYSHVMNDTNITTGGYVGSKMYIEGLNQAKTIINAAFGGHILNHRQLLCNATVDGKSSGWAWFSSEVELMNEIMIYGSSVFGDSNLGGGSGFNIGVNKSQLPLFVLNPRMINTRQAYWLRDVVSASAFAHVHSVGPASLNHASYSYGVRPAFSIS